MSAFFRLKSIPYWLLCSFGCSFSIAHGAVTLDGTLGRGGSLNGPDYAITSDLGRQVGANLFHSFGGFNLASGESATFSGPASVANIIGRVTGGGTSTIDGTLRSTISGANLYLLNPNGLIFGPNAALDLSGSFYGSTADYVKLADGGRFDASVPANTSLTSAPPSAFGFLGPAPAPVTVRGSYLAVNQGQGISLVGGNIGFDNAAFLWAPGGRVALVSGAAAGEVDLAGGTGFASGGNIVLGPRGEVNVGADDTSGSIVIRGGRLQLEQARLVAGTVNQNGGSIDIAVSEEVTLVSGAEITTTTSGSGQGGDVLVRAGTAITLSGRDADENYSAIRANTTGAGNAGRIELTAPRISLDEGLVQSLTSGGEAGAMPNGRGGGIAIRATMLNLLNGGQLDSGSRNGSSGNGGNVEIRASEGVVIDGVHSVAGHPSGVFARTDGAGTGGHIGVETTRLSISGGAQISANNTGAGSGGSVEISATESLTVSGSSEADYSAIRVNTNGAGNGGAVKIVTGALTIDAGLIQTLTFGERVTGGRNGNAGNVTIRAADVVLRNGGQIDSGSRDQSNGNGGNVEIRASGNIMIEGSNDVAGHPSGIFAKTEGDGAGGSVLLYSPIVTLAGGAKITVTSVGRGAGGFVTIDAADSLGLSGGESSVVANAESSGSGGYIDIRARQVMLDDGAKIQALASGTGAGGFVRVASTSLSLTNGGAVSATTSGSGAGGYIDISASNRISVEGQTADGNTSGIRASTFGTGAGGNIFLTAPSINLDQGLIQALTDGDLGQGVRNGDGGYVVVNAGGLTLRNGAQIDSSSRNHSSGNGGAIWIEASDFIDVSGRGARFPSAIFANTFGSGDGGFIFLTSPRLTVADGAYIQAATTGSGPGGYVVVKAAQMEVNDGGIVSAATFGTGTGGYIWIEATESVTLRGKGSDGQPSTIAAQTTWSGDGGYIRIETPQLTLDGGEISSSSSGSGWGGLIDIEADRLSLRNGAKIESRGIDIGDAGDIEINAGIFDSSRGAVTTEAAYASGGNIKLNATSVRLSEQSAISATVGGGYGDGGNVTVSARGIAAVGNSDITARADQGFGGRITINAEAFLRGKDVDLDASSNVIGNEGVVEVNAPKLDISGSLVVLPAAFLDASGLLSDPCAASHASQESSFVVRGRGGVPAQPDGPLPSSLLADPAAPPANKISSPWNARPSGWKHADCKQSSLLEKENRL